MIVIYTKSNCGKCDDIKKHLTDNSVEFMEKNSEDSEVMQKLISLITSAGIKNPLLPICEFDDGSVISNDMGLYRELKQRGIL